ncbi:MAG: hypothetical protein ACK47B_28370 [Armatimonadota bacterium]
MRRRYKVDGPYLVPVPETEAVDYVPLAHYRAPGAEERSPYFDFLESDEEHLPTLGGLANHWGPLGLLQRQVVQIRYLLGPEHPLLAPFGLPGTLEVTDLPQGFEYEPGTYRLRFGKGATLPDQLIPEIEERLREAGIRRWFDAEAGKAWALVSDPVTGTLRELPLYRVLRPYLPQLWAETGRAPEGEALQDGWRLADLVCEPVAEVQQALQDFRNVYAGVAGYTDDRTRISEAPEAQCQLTRALRRVSPRVAMIPPVDTATGDPGWRSGWTTPSLLDSLYTMLWLDINRGYYVRICGNESCAKGLGRRKPFITDQLKNRFCSTKCYHVQRQREYREEQKQRRAAAPD